jgi:uncharacterized protein (TIGR04255 family)
MATDKPLPKFDDPPVIETVLAVQFDPLPKFKNAHLGLFLADLGDEWLNVSDAPPLPPQFERFEPLISWENVGIQFEVTQEITLRMQARNAAKNRMIQLQNGRLFFNWLGESGEGYPSYESVKPEFEQAVSLFKSFIRRRELGDFRSNQWEVTYLNHLPKGTVWSDDWAAPFQLLIASSGSPAGTKAESFGGEWHFEIVPQRGRLHLQLKNGWRKKPKTEEILLLTLTARGPASNEEDLLNGLDVGHETIVRAFADLTSYRAQEFWRRTQ